MANSHSSNILFCSVVLLSCGVLVLSTMDPQEESEMVKLYEEWKIKYGHLDKGPETDPQRFDIFKSNVKHINAHNKVKGRKYDLAINKFADLTRKEFMARYTGFRIPPGTKIDRNENNTYSDEPEIQLIYELPYTVDWRKDGAVGSIRDQGNCGSCWAFSAVAAMEGITQIKTGKLVDLSEKELVDCDYPKNNGCSGGLMHTAFEWIINNKGLNSEQAYPYKAVKGKCNKIASNISIANISSYKFVKENDQLALHLAVSRQPVSIAVDASSIGFAYYSGGVFTGKCGTNLNHAVTLVGYDFLEDGTAYWIVRNSWGKDWGEGGYMRMLRNINAEEGLCGLGKYAVYPEK